MTFQKELDEIKTLEKGDKLVIEKLLYIIDNLSDDIPDKTELFKYLKDNYNDELVSIRDSEED